MHCIESSPKAQLRPALWTSLMAVLALAAGCASKAPAPAPAPAPVVATPVPARPAATPAPAPARPAAAPAPVPAPVAAAPAPAPSGGPLPDLGPRVVLPAAAKAANWNDFKRMAARRMVAASPRVTYMGKPPPMLYAISVLEVELNADGTVRDISVTRPPAKEEAQDTIDIAKAAIRRGEPYGDVSRMPKPWKFTEVFLFNDQRKFKPRTLD